MVDVSIIIINFRTSEMTKDAIHSIETKSSGFSYEIIVVDNSCDEDEFNKLSCDASKNTKFIKATSNLGFGRANNLGAKIAKGKYLFFLNSDTLLINNAIEELFTFSESNFPCVVGPNLYAKDGSPGHSYFLKVRNARNTRIEYSLCLHFLRSIFRRKSDFNFSNHPKRVMGYICGASLMLPQSCFETIGGFDDDIFMYAEENLLCFRLQKELNLRLFNIPSSKITHFEGGSFDHWSNERLSRFLDGNKIYFTKAFGKQEYHKFLKAMKSAYQRRYILSFLFANKKRKDFKRMYNSFKTRLMIEKNKEKYA